MKNIFKHKLLIILFMFLLVLNLKTVFAVNMDGYSLGEIPSNVLDYLYNTDEYSDLNTYDYFIFKATNGAYVITFFEKSNTPMSGYFTTFDGNCLNFKFNQAFNYKQYILNSNGSFNNTLTNTSNIDSVWGLLVNNSNFIWNSSFNIYTDDTYENVFFQAPPAQEQVELEGIIAPILQETTMEGVLQEVVNLLPMILSVLVSLLAFYKALRILVTFLQQS